MACATPLSLTARHLVSHPIDPHFHIPRVSHNFSLTNTHSLNFLLSHTLPNPQTRLHNFSFESAISSVSAANNCWFISNLYHLHSAVPALSQAPCVPLSHHTIHIYMKQPWIHHATLSQSNINWKPLTHIHPHPDTRPAVCIKILHLFQQFSFNTIHS